MILIERIRLAARLRLENPDISAADLEEAVRAIDEHDLIQKEMHETRRQVGKYTAPAQFPTDDQLF